VVQNSKKWKPGKQRGVPVRVKMAVPIYFKLNN
jgi:periplasmic protein TonB